MDERLRLQIGLKAWFWRCILRPALLWCRCCRWWHTKADNLCGWLAHQCEGDIEDDNEPIYCQDCGRLISWDCKNGDDIIRPAYVTASGDLFCDLCGRQYDEEDERLADEEADYWPDPQDYDIGETDESQDWEPKLGGGIQ